jgi:hypothetical protein
MGSAVDRENLTHNLDGLARAGIGAVEITPIYGVQGNDANEIPYLSPRWMDMFGHTSAEAGRLGMRVDMSTGSGWPFGGPLVSGDDAATRLIIREYTLSGGGLRTLDVAPEDERRRAVATLDRLMAFSAGGRCIDLTARVEGGRLTWRAPRGDWRLIAAFSGKTFQRVKRAAPGGEGWVIDHFSAAATGNYLSRFTEAFRTAGATPPRSFFCDSYEVYGADWTPDLFAQFAARRGYRLEEHLPAFLDTLRTDVTARIVSDYRETLSELLLDHFTRQWTDWAHTLGATTRSQAHGSPGNLIDLYAAVDIPECEGFGLSDFGIDGLRRDSLTRPNDADLSMLKYASSAAHIAGRPYTSAETLTWLTEHFRTSLSQCKPDVDLMFTAGVNRICFHGATYSPAAEPWPGWKFYASVDMSPTNSIWRDAPAFSDYIARCQSFLQMGAPDNDFLVYLPVCDIWHEQPGRLLMFDIHGMAERAPRFIDAVRRITRAGYDADYISDRFVRSAVCAGGRIVTPGGASYRALIVPGARLMPHDVLDKLFRLADEGATVVFLDRYPEDVPGYARLEARRAAFRRTMRRAGATAGRKGRVIFGADYAATLAQTGVTPEAMRTEMGLSLIRRTNPGGHHYFVSALRPEGVEGWAPLAVSARSAAFYNPMNGATGKAAVRRRGDHDEVYLQLASGESVILRTWADADIALEPWRYPRPDTGREAVRPSGWSLTFTDTEPAIAGVFALDSLGSWTGLDIPAAQVAMGAGCYRATIDLTPAQWSAAEAWTLHLGDVRESARIRINGSPIATLWAAPFRCTVRRDSLHPGGNVLEVEVTNLPANRIADMDRQGVPWRKFKEINLVDRNYRTTGYGHWQPVASGLLGPVTLTPVRFSAPPQE